MTWLGIAKDTNDDICAGLTEQGALQCTMEHFSFTEGRKPVEFDMLQSEVTLQKGLSTSASAVMHVGQEMLTFGH